MIRILGVLAIAAALIVDPGKGSARDRLQPAQLFSADELQLVSRNKTLSSAYKLSPPAVRALLDSAKDGAASDNTAPRMSAPATPQKFNPKTDPDADRLNRASPEAIHDLFQIVKQAKTKRIKPNS